MLYTDFMNTAQHHYTYILRCGDNTLYTGYTNDIQKRLAAHMSGKGAKYTRGRGPLTLVYLEDSPTKEIAMQREWEIKHKLSREQKEALIASQPQVPRLPNQ